MVARMYGKHKSGRTTKSFVSRGHRGSERAGAGNGETLIQFSSDHGEVLGRNPRKDRIKIPNAQQRRHVHGIIMNSVAPHHGAPG